MKASELIAELQKIIEDSGDLEVKLDSYWKILSVGGAFVDDDGTILLVSQ